MACQDRSEEGVVDVLRTTELRKSEPKDNDRLEKVIECYPSRSATFCQERESYAASTRLSLTNIRRH
jgi:hypothetical protein